MNERIKALKHIYELAATAGSKTLISFDPTSHPEKMNLSEIAYATVQQDERLQIVKEMIDEADAADGHPEATCKLAMGVLAKHHVEGMFVISTGHVSEETMTKVSAGAMPVVSYECGKTGALVYVTPEQDGWNDHATDNINLDLPDDLYACMSAARERGCCWLMLDADGEKLESLSIFDW